MKIFKIIIIICNILLLINPIHFGLFGVLLFFKRHKETKVKIKKQAKYLILIAARNEEKVIGNLIDSLNSQNYDKKLYKICVLPNNSSDNTKQIALDKNCLVIEPPFSPKSKGEVLNYAFDYFKDDKSFDTYVIFDADNVVERNFLKNMNKKLNEGYKVIQGFRDTKNLYDNYLSGSYALFFYLQSFFMYEARNRINQGSTLNGTGYAVLKEFIDSIKHKAKTITEDIELTCVCALNHEKIGYEESAVFYDEQVTNYRVSVKQRKRWIQGSMQVFKHYYKNLFKSIKENNCFQLFDMFQILFLPVNQALAFVAIILSYIFIVPFKMIILGLLVGYIGEVILSIFLILYFKKNLKKLVVSCLFFPIFHVSWLPIYLYAIFNSYSSWEEIEHNSSLKIEEMLEN